MKKLYCVEKLEKYLYTIEIHYFNKKIQLKLIRK